MIWDISCRLNWPHMYAEDVKKSVMKRMKWWGYPNCQPCPLQRRLFTNRSNQNVIYCFMLGWLLTHSLAASVKEYTCASFCDSVQHQNLCVASCWPPHSRSTLKNIPSSPRLSDTLHIRQSSYVTRHDVVVCCEASMNTLYDRFLLPMAFPQLLIRTKSGTWYAATMQFSIFSQGVFCTPTSHIHIITTKFFYLAQAFPCKGCWPTDNELCQSCRVQFPKV